MNIKQFMAKSKTNGYPCKIAKLPPQPKSTYVSEEAYHKFKNQKGIYIQRHGTTRSVIPLYKDIYNGKLRHDACAMYDEPPHISDTELKLMNKFMDQ